MTFKAYKIISALYRKTCSSFAGNEHAVHRGHHSQLGGTCPSLNGGVRFTAAQTEGFSSCTVSPPLLFTFSNTHNNRVQTLCFLTSRREGSLFLIGILFRFGFSFVFILSLKPFLYSKHLNWMFSKGYQELIKLIMFVKSQVAVSASVAKWCNTACMMPDHEKQILSPLWVRIPNSEVSFPWGCGLKVREAGLWLKG